MAAGSEPTLSQLGEFAVIARIVGGRTDPAGVRVGPGDDAAVIDAPDGRVVVSTDMLVENRHFRLDHFHLRKQHSCVCMDDITGVFENSVLRGRACMQ